MWRPPAQLVIIYRLGIALCNNDIPDGHGKEILLHVFAAGLESGLELIHRRRVEVGTVAAGRQYKIERTFQVMIVELE